MFYDRKIKYLDYMENGQRLRNGGFVKFEVRDDICCVTLQVCGLRIMEQYNCKIYFLEGTKKELFSEFTLQQGKGTVQLSVNRGNLCGDIPYDRLEAIQIPISAGRELYCTIAEKRKEEKIKENKIEENKLKEEKVVEEPEKEEKFKDGELCEKQEALVAEEHLKRIEVTRTTDYCEKQKESKNIEAQTEKKQIEEEEVIEVKRKTWKENIGEQHKEKTVKMAPRENKWEQLIAIYPHIKPFHDEREYLSVGPGDFVILDEKYYKLVNNSFLLHGFYNYKHLILTCVERKMEKQYYIGVPGNFYEREKQVALMFGFESFECREEPACMGDFGYYMIKVEI